MDYPKISIGAGMLEIEYEDVSYVFFAFPGSKKVFMFVYLASEELDEDGEPYWVDPWVEI